jgi:hypothetical protein
VVLSISAYQFISRALDVGGIKSAQTWMFFYLLQTNIFLYNMYVCM